MGAAIAKNYLEKAFLRRRFPRRMLNLTLFPSATAANLRALVPRQRCVLRLLYAFLRVGLRGHLSKNQCLCRSLRVYASKPP